MWLYMVVWFPWTKSRMLAWAIHELWLVGWELAWELDVWDKGGGYGMKHEFGVW